MGDSGRRRSSLFDLEEENKRFTSRGRYRDYSASGADDSLRPKDHSGYTSWEDKGDSISKDQLNIAERREVIERNSYYKNMSPGLDGVEQQNWSRSPDNRWSQSRRYTGRGRSRSRSRGRGRSRSRSRSWSRGRNKGRGWSRSRSRSRSRGSPRGRTRSRSPLHDQGRESYEWSDRRSGSGRFSQTCRNFAVGMCRRGSQCKFLHPDNVEHRDANSLETGPAGRWRSKPEPGRSSRYSYDKPRDKFSDPYDGEDEPLRNRSRSTVSCIDFVKGNCRFGAACRFSHHSGSQKDDYNRGSRIMAADPDHERRQNRTGKTLCKFFLAGNCQRSNCRFSHDDPASNDVDDRSRDNNGGQSTGNISKWWNGPTFDDDAARSSSIRTKSGWGETGNADMDGVADMDLSEEFSVDRRSEGRRNRNLDTESKLFCGAGYDDKGFNRDKTHTFCRGDGNNGVDMSTVNPMVRESSFGQQGDHLVSQNFQSQNVDEFSPCQSQQLNAEASVHHLPTTSPKLSTNADIHPHQGHAEHNRVEIFGSGLVYEVKDSGNPNGQSIKTDNRSAFSEHSSILNGVDQGHHVMSPIGNQHSVDLNQPAQHIGSPLSLHNERQSHQQEVTPTVLQMSSAPYSFPKAVSTEQVAPMTTLPPQPTQDLVDEHRPQLHKVTDLSNPMLISPSPNTTHPALTVYTLNIADSMRCADQYNPVKIPIEQARTGSNDQTLVSSSYSNGQENPKPLELLSSLSIVNPEFRKVHQSSSSGVERPDLSKLHQHEISEEPEDNSNDRMVTAGFKPEPKNISSENVDAQGKTEGGNSNKDDKGIRLFKNALVEFVKEILKPTWKEGKMSREVHKTIVKKVVDKVTSSIQGEHVPKTQDKIELYLSSSKPKITKLVQAYVERSNKADS